MMRLITDYNTNMTKCKDKLLEYSRGLTRGNKIHGMEPFDEPPTRESQPGSSTGRSEGSSAAINS
eukprot:8476123-Karenia_brevis.AAC.1